MTKTYQPGEWQTKLVRDLLRLGYAGFQFNKEGWSVLADDPRRTIVAGPFATMEAIDTWIAQHNKE
jgi:hypothetical protein